LDNVEFERPSEEFIAQDWEEFTAGSPVFGVLRGYEPRDVGGLAWRDLQRKGHALVTWWIDQEAAEIVSVHVEPPGSGMGARLMDAAEAELKRRGVKQVVLATTNDKPRALSFYIKRGYRLVRLHLDAMDRVRQVKSRVPLIGDEGIPLRDMWEPQKEL
jgi:ribosomal protein S18 acetylase RimI-like enzyme